MKKYTHKEWSKTAKTFSSGEETKDYFSSLLLAGKTIKTIRILGFDYCHSEWRLALWQTDYCEKNNIPLNIPDNDTIPDVDFSLIPDDLPDKRFVELDEPFIIEFTNGQQLEIEADGLDNQIKIAFNEIPDNAEPSINNNNIDGNIIFSPCLGKTITAVKFLSKRPKEYIPAVILVLNDGTQINIECWLDYFDVWLSKESDTNEILPIPWGELKKGLRLQK